MNWFLLILAAMSVISVVIGFWGWLVEPHDEDQVGFWGWTVLTFGILASVVIVCGAVALVCYGIANLIH